MAIPGEKGAGPTALAGVATFAGEVDSPAATTVDPPREGARSLRHELLTPLNQIIGYSELLQAEADDRGEASFVADLRKIEAAGRHLLDLVNALTTPGGPLSAAAEPSAAPRAATPAPAASTPEPGPAGSDADRSPARPAQILVVDDNELNRDMLSRRLAKRGYDVATAAGGAEALARLADQAFDLVLLDVMMPEVSGLDVLAAVRQSRSRSELPIIMATAKDDSQDIVGALSLGANDYVTKPLDFAVVMARVEAQLALKRAVEETRVLNRELLAAQERIAELTDSSAGAVTDVSAWATSMARQVAEAVGAREIAVWLLDGEEVAAVTGDAPAPSAAQIEAAARTAAGLPRGGDVLMALTGLSGALVGALAVVGWKPGGAAASRGVLTTFARHLGSALELRRLRKELDDAAVRSRATREELLKQGVSLLQICPVCRRCYDQNAARCEDDGAVLGSPRPFPYEVAGRYRVTRLVGEGGMGTVYRAEDLRLGRAVALKVLKGADYGAEEVRFRFQAEARAIARVDHAGVIQVYDSGEIFDGTPYMAMEWLDGRDLGALLAEHGAGTPAQVARLLRLAAAALAAAHRAGIVHRDVKPANIFLVPGPGGFAVKLLDFGVAKATSADMGLTRTGTLVGTPLYMSPEQALGRPAERRSDLYSLCAVVYEALVGRRLVEAQDYVAILIEIATKEPPSVSALVPGAGAAVDEGFALGLAKSRDTRPGNVEEWAGKLADALERVPARTPGWGWPAAGRRSAAAG